jgi:hypothetical protein
MTQPPGGTGGTSGDPGGQPPPVPPEPPPAVAAGTPYGSPTTYGQSGGGAGPPGGISGVYQRMGGQNNIFGWLSLALGVISTGCCCCWCLDGAPFIGGLPAIILGVLHLTRVRQGRATMSWTAWVGIVLAIIAVIGAIIGLATNWEDDMYRDYQW